MNTDLFSREEVGAHIRRAMIREMQGLPIRSDWDMSGAGVVLVIGLLLAILFS